MPSASASCSWLIPSILRRIRNRLPTCWSVGLGPSFAAMVSEPPWLTARQSYEQKILPTLGHSTSRFNEQFLDKGLRNITSIARDYSHHHNGSKSNIS